MRSPTSGAAVAPTAPSKERSNAYTADRSCSGTISANIALLFVPDLRNNFTVELLMHLSSLTQFVCMQ